MIYLKNGLKKALELKSYRRLNTIRHNKQTQRKNETENMAKKKYRLTLLECGSQLVQRPFDRHEIDRCVVRLINRIEYLFFCNIR